MVFVYILVYKYICILIQICALPFFAAINTERFDCE